MSHRFAKRHLMVYANPWSAIDHKGRPSGACPCDPVAHTPDRAFVGAYIVSAAFLRTRETTRVKGQVGGDDLRSVPQDTVWWFSEEPVEIPATHYYFDKIKKGELIAADEYTAQRAQITQFKDPKAMLAAARAEAIANFNAAYGEGSFELLDKQRNPQAEATAATTATGPDTPPPVAQVAPPPATAPAPVGETRSARARAKDDK